MFLPYYSNSCYESDYECICIVINGKIRSVALNILSSVYSLTICHLSKLIHIVFIAVLSKCQSIFQFSDLINVGPSIRIYT